MDFRHIAESLLSKLEACPNYEAVVFCGHDCEARVSARVAFDIESTLDLIDDDTADFADAARIAEGVMTGQESSDPAFLDIVIRVEIGGRYSQRVMSDVTSDLSETLRHLVDAAAADIRSAYRSARNPSPITNPARGLAATFGVMMPA